LYAELKVKTLKIYVATYLNIGIQTTSIEAWYSSSKSPIFYVDPFLMHDPIMDVEDDANFAFIEIFKH